MSTESPTTGASEQQINAAVRAKENRHGYATSGDIRKITEHAEYLVPPDHAIVPAALLTILRRAQKDATFRNAGRNASHSYEVAATIWRDLMAVLDAVDRGQG